MKPIIKWTVQARRLSILWWILGIIAYVVLELAFYPSIRDQAAELEKSFSSLSDSAIALFSDTGDFFSPVGYLSGQVFYLLMPMLLGILAIGAGASLVGREEREGTLELLLSRPISRSRLMAAKAVTGIFIIAVVGLVGGLATAVMSKLVDLPIPFGNIMLAGVASTVLAISFGSVAFMITMLGRSARVASVGLSSLVALAGYLLTSLASNVSWLSGPSKVFPFAYYHPAEILEGNYNWLNMLFIVGVIALCGVVSWIAFRRRDLISS
ncbi:ABC transporter permease subunit [Candidatus Saccharibacteria bacterium]|nr:ABC transporter permease subunit [Candidatus Saccharibacteria bacterium]